MKNIPITQIPGVKIGHAHDLDAATGCTAILCEQGAVAGVDVRGGAPGTRETDLLAPENLVGAIHAVMLAGGSAFGLDAASGAMEFLEQAGVGFDVGVTKVPIVCSAVLFDLLTGDFRVRPDKEMGRRACENAGKEQTLEGCVGAGAGATVGKLLGMDRAMKSGLGISCVEDKGLIVGAVVAVNCLGDVLDPEAGKLVAGLLAEDGKTPASTEEALAEFFMDKSDLFSGNTTLGVVITNAQLTKAQARKLASMSHNGFARSMRPAHSMYDGDTIFALGTGERQADLTVVGMLAARMVERAVVRAATQATSLHGLACHADIYG